MSRFVRRKWGWYLTLLDRKHFKVKLLRFYKGKSCSLQYHKNRTELWLCLSGFGHLNEEKYGKLQVINMHNGSYADPIQPLKKHSFHAHKSTYIIEIQYGEKCVEEDIVRV